MDFYDPIGEVATILILWKHRRTEGLPWQVVTALQDTIAIKTRELARRDPMELMTLLHRFEEIAYDA